MYMQFANLVINTILPTLLTHMCVGNPLSEQMLEYCKMDH